MSAIKEFFDKYKAVLVKSGHGRPDYTCRLSTLARLVEIADQLAGAYTTAGDKDREFIARDLSDIEFEVQVRWVMVLNSGK